MTRFLPLLLPLSALAACGSELAITVAGAEQTNICGDTGIGFPLNSDNFANQAIDADWMTEKQSVITVTAECMTIPPLRVSTPQSETMPITSLTFSLATYDNAAWATQFGNELTVSGAGGTIATATSTDMNWALDLTERDLAVSPEQDLFLTFQLPGFDDPSEIDELWDNEVDQLAIMVNVGHSWSEETEPGYIEFGAYSSGSLLTINVEPLDE